ncbi:MAG: NB-ARC domain-containing protein, partial [Candidatus Fimimonas sp.]
MQFADYKYDVFLSWTGKDAQLKNAVKQCLENAGFSCYDSELNCNGTFRDNYVQALQASKVYLILMTDNLRNNPNESGKGTFTEVRKEFSLALDLEAHGDLNVELLNFSEFFCYKEVYRDLSDQLGWFFYVNTRGYSRLDALDGLTESVFSKLISDVGHFVNCRNKQRPVLSQKPKLGVEVFPVANCVDFYGREMELLQISNAFLQGAKVVALYGMDGMGKLSIARRFAQACNDSETFVCAQIVRVQNKDYREQGGVYPSVVSSVAYSDGAISRYASDVEKQAQKARVLFNLPDFVLLVVDNVSELTLDDVNLFLRLNCKVLITTRVKPDFEAENFKSVEVGSLPLTDAYAMFCKLSQQKEQDVSKEKFSQLYNVVGGHTMTLCLVAKAAKKHKKSVEEMLQEFETTGEFSENVSHKDSADKICEETISAHLQRLFGLQNQIDKDGESVLRNLSLIAEGKMPCKLLCEQLGFFNRNAVLELERSGWASLDEKDFLCLHPLASQLANNLLAPTSKNAAVAVQYVVSNAQNRNVTYGDVGLAFDGLFFALFRIAKNEKKLCNVLWEEFEKASLLVSDFEKLQICCRKLADVLKGFDDQGAKKVQLFVDANSIERYPTKLEVLSAYLPTLATSVDDYKFVMRALSITSDFFVESAQSRATLLNVLHKALLAAAEKDDGLAVCSLATSYLMLGGKDVEAKVVQKFLKKHKN